MKKKKSQIREHTGDSLHIEFSEWLGDDQYIKKSIILRPVTPILFFGENANFEWEGSYGDKNIKVILPRQTIESEAKIIGEFPNKVDGDLGTTYNQLYKELRRVINQLN